MEKFTKRNINLALNVRLVILLRFIVLSLNLTQTHISAQGLYASSRPREGLVCFTPWRLFLDRDFRTVGSYGRNYNNETK